MILPASEATKELRQSRSTRVSARAKLNKTENAKHFKNCLRNLPTATLRVYSDGASTGPTLSAYGYAVFKDG